MVLSPVLGLVGGFLLMTAILWGFRRAAPGPTARGFRYAQTVSAAAMAFGHGMQDAAKTAGRRRPDPRRQRLPARRDDLSIPWWVIALSAVVLSLGTYAGGWRIMRTLGAGSSTWTRRTASPPRRPRRRCSTPRPPRERRSRRRTRSPAAIMGVGATRSAKAVRWGVARQIVAAWVLTFPGQGSRQRRLLLLSLLSGAGARRPPRPASRLPHRWRSRRQPLEGQGSGRALCGRSASESQQPRSAIRSPPRHSGRQVRSAEAAGDVVLGARVGGVAEDLRRLGRTRRGGRCGRRGPPRPRR